MADKKKKPRSLRSRLGGLLLGVVVFGYLGLRLIVPGYVESKRNVVRRPQPYSVPPKASKLHADMLVADMHADTLLWSRDLLEESTRGHVDLPRLRRANVALQCFTVVTKSPKGQNVSSNSSKADDNITLLAFAQGWPPATYFSLHQRALYQATKLHDAAERSNGQLRVIRYQEDLAEHLEARKKSPKLVAGLLGIEGAHCLEGKLEHVEGLYDAGYRMIGLTHFFDNELGGSAHGEAKPGLTEFGKTVVAELEQRKILIDLAHAAPAVIDDVLKLTKRPPVVSHTGVRGVADSPRNLSDAHVEAIAKKGGLIGIGFWEVATGGTDVKSIVTSIRYVAKLVGVEHVALGSDFDGSVTVPFDVTGLPLLTQALLDDGFNDSEVKKIMGGNLLRLLAKQLPQRPTAK